MLGLVLGTCVCCLNDVLFFGVTPFAFIEDKASNFVALIFVVSACALLASGEERW